MKRKTVDRLKALLLERAPAGCRVSDRGNNFFCNDDVALYADLYVRTPEGRRLAVTEGAANPMILAAWFGYDLADEVWCVDPDTAQVEQFGKETGVRVVPFGEEIHSIAIPALSVFVGAAFDRE